MKLLLDAQAFLWFIGDNPRLSTKARALIADQGNDLILSSATCWEIAIKVSLGKLKLRLPYSQFMPSALEAHKIELLPVGLGHLARVAELPFHHRDPFDRLLAAQSLEEGIALVSVDQEMDAYGVQRLW